MTLTAPAIPFAITQVADIYCQAENLTISIILQLNMSMYIFESTVLIASKKVLI